MPPAFTWLGPTCEWIFQGTCCFCLTFVIVVVCSWHFVIVVVCCCCCCCLLSSVTSSYLPNSGLFSLEKWLLWLTSLKKFQCFVGAIISFRFNWASIFHSAIKIFSCFAQTFYFSLFFPRLKEEYFLHSGFHLSTCSRYWTIHLLIIIIVILVIIIFYLLFLLCRQNIF